MLVVLWVCQCFDLNANVLQYIFNRFTILVFLNFLISTTKYSIKSKYVANYIFDLVMALDGKVLTRAGAW